MKIFVKVMQPRHIRGYLIDLLGAVSTVSDHYTEQIASECDLWMIEPFFPSGLMCGGFFASYSALITVCPRTKQTYVQMAKQWHEVIGRILPYRTKTIDYDAFKQAAIKIGYNHQQIVDKLVGFDHLRKLRDTLCEDEPIVKLTDLQIDQFKVFDPYQRSLYEYEAPVYPTFDLWSPHDIQKCKNSQQFNKVYDVVLSEQDDSTTIKLVKTTTES